MNKTIRDIQISSKINWRARFEEFLKHYDDWNGKRIVEAFYINVKSNTDDQYHFPREDHYSFVIGAFAWIDTPEGFDFWDEIDMDWRDYIDNVESLKGQNVEIKNF